MSEHNDRDKDIIHAIVEQGNLTRYTILQAADAIVKALRPVPDKLMGTLIIKGEQMLRKVEAPMTVPVGTTGTTLVVETAAGVIVPTVGPIAYASDNPAVATYASDGTWAAVGAGTANMSQLDQTNGLTDTTPLTVTTVAPPVADTLIGTLVPNPTAKRR